MNRTLSDSLWASFDSSSDAIFIKDLSGTYLYANSASAHNLGRTRSDVLGRNDLDLFDPEMGRKIIETDRQILESGESTTFDEIYIIDKKACVFRVTKTPLLNAEGKFDRLLGVCREISSLKQESEHWQELSLRNEKLIKDDSSEIYFVLDHQGLFRHANRAAQKFFGQSLEYLIGKPIATCFPEKALMLDQLHDACVRRDELSESECLSYQREHQLQDKYYSIRVYFGPRTRSYYLDDITHATLSEMQLKAALESEKAARAEAQLAHDRLNDTAKALPNFLWEFDLALGYTWDNGGMAAYTGEASEALTTGDRFFQLIHPNDRDAIYNNWTAAIAQRAGYSGEFRLRGKDGHYQWFEANVIPIKNQAGEICRYSGVTTCIQVIKDLDEQRANFLSLVSHELKTPLTSIRASLEMLQRLMGRSVAPDLGALNRLIGVGVQSSVRLTHLIDDLLTLSRFESGKLVVHPLRSDLVTVVYDVVQSLKVAVELQEKKELICNLPERLEGDWDANRLRQVVDNLLANAVKYSSKLGRIEVTLLLNGDWAELEVKDDGIGIAKEDQVRIFKPFERAVKATNYGGLGIGLYVSARIVELHHGKIEVSSEVGRGACFKVSLPLRQPPGVRMSE